jgi:nucleotide-binding universal stress UspA family protein
MLRRILVTLDGSSFAEAALPPAVALAAKSGAQLRLLSVDPPAWSAPDLDVPGMPASNTAAYLDVTRTRLEPVHARISTSLREGFAAEEILIEARDFDPDLIVMATHGRGPVSRFWMGSVADRCVRAAHRPVLLVRPAVPDAGPTGEPFSGHRVVVPLDGSDLAERALAPAMELARVLGSSIALLRVVQERAMYETALIPETQRENARMLERAQRDAATYLWRVADRVAESGFLVTTEVPVANQIADALVLHGGSDLLVIATHARTGLDRAFLGSVAGTVVRSATGPVLVLPPEPVHGAEGAAAGDVGAGEPQALSRGPSRSASGTGQRRG